MITAIRRSGETTTAWSSSRRTGAPLASLGSVVFQPGLGKVADAWGYPASYVVSAGIELLALPFVLLARRERAPSDPIAPGTRGDRCAEPVKAAELRPDGAPSGTP